MNYTFLGNTTLAWLAATGVALAVMAGLYGAKALIVRRLGAIAKRTNTRYDDVLVAALASTRMPVMLVIGLYAGSTMLELGDKAALFLSRVAMGAALVQGAIWADSAVRAWLAQYRTGPQVDPGRATSTAALGFIVRVVVWAVFLLMILDNLGFNITTLVASLGIGGIAVALAVQNILGDLFASLSIVLDKPFVIGDFIVVGDSLGTVEYVGLKTTRVRSLSGEQIIFSNADLLNSRIHNLRRMETRRVVFSVGVTYGTAEELLRALPGEIAQIIKAQEKVTFDRAHFKAFGASSLDIEVVYIVNSPDYATYMDVQQEIYLQIYRRFGELGADFAFPTQTLHVVGMVPEAEDEAREGTAIMRPASPLRARIAGAASD